MLIYIMLTAILIASIVAEFMFEREVSPIAFLSISIVSMILGLHLYSISIAILFPIVRAILLLFSKSQRILISVAIYTLKPFIFILIFISIALYLRKTPLYYLDIWTSSLVFLATTASSLMLLAEPSINDISGFGSLFSKPLNKIITFLNILSLILTVIAIPILILYLKTWSLITIAMLGSFLILRNRIRSLIIRKLILLIPIILSLIISLILGV